MVISDRRATKESQKDCRGFTIIEVSLVTAFIAVLLISIAVVISNIMAVYQKGITLKAVNSVGRNLVEELTTSINSAPSVDTDNLCRTYAGDNETACREDHAFKFIFQSRTGEDPETHQPVQYGGLLCTGNYSYIWNTQYGINAGAIIRLNYNTNDSDNLLIPGATDKDTLLLDGLIRFEDKNYQACASAVNRNYQTTGGLNGGGVYTVNIREYPNGLKKTIPKPESNFLEDFDLPLALYELTVFPISQDLVTLRSFFSGTFILATDRGGVNIMRTDDYCSVLVRNEDGAVAGANTLDLGSDFNYCAINKFNFAARTAGV